MGGAIIYQSIRNVENVSSRGRFAQNVQSSWRCAVDDLVARGGSATCLISLFG